jgi:glycosyltransferase involved in cell wall biosynthesis
MKHISEKLIGFYNDKVEVCTTDSLYNPEGKIYKKITPATETINNVLVSRMPFSRWHYPLITGVGKVIGKLFNKPLPLSIAKLRWGIDSLAMKNKMITSKAEVIMATTIIYNFSDYPFWRHERKNPKPFVLYGAIHLHKDLPRNDLKIERAKACDCYIANTDFEREKLIEYGIDPEKIVTIGTGISIEDFDISHTEVKAFKEQHSIKETDVLIGYIGRLVKGKGVAILIDALRELKKEDKNVKLLLAGGTTDYVPEIRRIIEREGLPVILIENFPEAKKNLLFNVLDVFVLASQSESFGVVFLEAWACKKPVIGTRMGAIESLLSEGEDSLLFEPNDVDDLCLKVKQLISDAAKRIEFGLNGYKKVEENYTWPVIVSKYREAYQLAIRNFSISKELA